MSRKDSVEEYQLSFQDGEELLRGRVKPVSVEVMRGSDARTIAGGTDSKELMRRAGRAIYLCADWRAPAAVVCGKGNNAGDGYVTALYLKEAGIDCSLVLLDPERFSEDGRYYYDLCMEQGIRTVSWEDCKGGLEGYGSIMDCLLGTGFHGSPRGAMADLINAVNMAHESGCYVVSADINSGMNGDSGLGEPCVQSDLTVSIGSFKPAHAAALKNGAAAKCINADIGITIYDYYVYLLECSDGSLYCGMTNDLQRRLRAHNAGRGGHYTASRRPCALVYSEYAGSKSEALRRERALKKLSRSQKLEIIKAKCDENAGR